MQECEVLDLSGCSLEQVLYYISSGTPVLAMNGSEAVLLCGYDASSVSIYEPSTGTVQRQSLEEANTLFAGTGNIFYAYLK